MIMKPILPWVVIATAVGLLSGCATSGTKVEKGREGTIAYYVQVEASDSGVRIEAENDYVGNAPLTLKIFGDKDGTFHNFGSQEYVIKAYPTDTNRFVQTKVFNTGKWFQPEDKIPKRIFFDMTQKTGNFTIELPSKQTNR
jgi:hypothetical protein